MPVAIGQTLFEQERGKKLQITTNSSVTLEHQKRDAMSYAAYGPGARFTKYLKKNAKFIVSFP